MRYHGFDWTKIFMEYWKNNPNSVQPHEYINVDPLNVNKKITNYRK